MKELIGTEKQIKWAGQIRMKMLRSLVTVCTRIYESHPTLAATSSHAEITALMQAASESLLSQESAAWWIDHRDADVMDLVLSQGLTLAAVLKIKQNTGNTRQSLLTRLAG